MTIDKIKHYIGEELFNYWSIVKDKDVIIRAKKQLEEEINCGLLTDIRYHAELKFLNYLLT